MAHYAFLDENDIVTEVIVGIDETQMIEGLEPEIWYANFRKQKCKRTSFNGNIRKRYAAKGYKYLEKEDVFIEKQPFPSWSLNENFDWVAPISMPADGNFYWDEELGAWIETKTL